MGHKWYVNTINYKYVSEYCSISIMEVEELDLVEYLCYLRDARIFNYSKTDDGQKYLKNAWRIMQTAPERKKLREQFNKEK